MTTTQYDSVVIGGGFFGCSLATHLAKKKISVALIEQGNTLLARASYANQARVHHGYHYPRSFLTALRSRANYRRFKKDFEGCIYDAFTHYYAIPRRFSKVTASQFCRFMERIGAPMKVAPDRIKRLFSSHLIEEVFEVEECAFNAVALRDLILADLAEKDVSVHTATEVTKIVRIGKNLHVVGQGAEGENIFSAERVLNCTYSRINTILHAASLPFMKLKHEIAEMALIDVPEELKSMAVTVMCGPFFSLMPFPARGLHTLSHVRYTPHCSWQEGPGSEVADVWSHLANYAKKTKFEHMKRDAARYLPLLTKSVQRDSLWEVKTVLPQSESDDSRPILFRQAEGEPSLWCILGGKIDNIYDAIEQWDTHNPKNVNENKKSYAI